MNPTGLEIVDRAKGTEWLHSDALSVLELAGLGTDDSVLDLGAGYGRLTAYLLQHCGKVVACEPDPAMLQVLKARHGACPTLATASDIGACAPEGPFAAAILANHVIGNQPLRDDIELLSRVRALLAPGGRVVLSGLNPFQVVHRVSHEGFASFCSYSDSRGDLCIDEVRVDWSSSELRTKRVVRLASQVVEDEFVVRLYVPAELREMSGQAGFRSCEVFGDGLRQLDAGSTSMYCIMR
jgi:SAM-dependent methyltransferase